MATTPEQLNILDPLAYLSTLNRYLSAAEAAELLHRSTDTIYRRCKDGSLGHTRMGRDYMFSPADLIAYLEARKVPAIAVGGGGRRKAA
jgi:excisionase family DNA binding protein